VNYIYLDHAASTATRAEVHAAMEPFLGERYGNPSSIHRWGRLARNSLEEARERLAAALGAKRREVVFTGSGTEADNLAILGRWRAHQYGGATGQTGSPPGSTRATMVVSAIEHKAVSEAARQAAREGAELVVLGVDEAGLVAVDAVLESLSARPAVVSVMWGNNEIGTVQPVPAIGAACRERGVVFHTDAVQALGKVRVSVSEVACDLLSVSGHKIGGPVGVGALYVREGVALAPLAHGGGQERQLRPGTESVAAAVGLACAAELAVAEQEAEAARLSALRNDFEQRVLAGVPDVAVNAGRAPRLPHVSNVRVPGVDGEALVMGLDLEGVAVSGGSACSSGSNAPSPVIAALRGVARTEANVRFSLGRTTTAEDLHLAADRFRAVVARCRQEAAAPL